MEKINNFVSVKKLLAEYLKREATTASITEITEILDYIYQSSATDSAGVTIISGKQYWTDQLINYTEGEYLCSPLLAAYIKENPSLEKIEEDYNALALDDELAPDDPGAEEEAKKSSKSLLVGAQTMNKKYLRRKAIRNNEEQIRVLWQELLEKNPDGEIFIPEDLETKAPSLTLKTSHAIKIKDENIYGDIRLKSLLMRQFGLHPILPKNHDHLISLSQVVQTLHGHTQGRKNNDLFRKYIEELRKSKPQEIVNNDSGMTVLEAFKKYRTSAGTSYYIPEEAMPYLRYNYLDKMPKDKVWRTGRQLCISLGLSYSGGNSTNIKATGIVLKEIREEKRDEPVKPKSEIKIGDIIRCLVQPRLSAAWYIDESEIGLIPNLKSLIERKGAELKSLGRELK